MSDEVTKLIAKREQLNARLRQLKGKEKRSAKKTDDRRKILAGAFLLEQARRDPAISEWMTRGLSHFLVRPDERALFAGLAPQLVTDKAEGVSPGNERPIALPPAMAHASAAGAPQ